MLTVCLNPRRCHGVLHLFERIYRVFCTKSCQLITERRSISHFTMYCPFVVNNGLLADGFLQGVE